MSAPALAALLALGAAACLGVPDSTAGDGDAGGGDGDAGVVAPCGGIGAFAEPFDGDALAEPRWNVSGSGSTLAVGSGALAWSVDTADATTVLASDYYPAIDGVLEVRFAHPPQSTTSIQLGLVPAGGSPAVSFQIDGGVLTPGSFGGPLPDGSILRFRFGQGALRLEVEVPGQPAVEVASEVWDPDAHFAIALSAIGTVAGADLFTIDSIVGGPATPWCPAGSLFEDFYDDRALVFAGECTVASGSLTLGTCFATTAEPVDVRDSGISLDIVEATDVILWLLLGDDRKLTIERDPAGDLLFRDSGTTVGGLSGDFRRLRFVHAAGQLCAEGLDGELRSLGCVDVDDAAAAEARPLITSLEGARVDNLRGI